jgi:beta-lactamase regulating signal transducer with metallopeptidase domain/TolA-binding protein
MSFIPFMLFSNTLVAVCLAGLAFASRLLKRPALTHVLWLLVLLKLLTPPVIQVFVPSNFHPLPVATLPENIAPALEVERIPPADPTPMHSIQSPSNQPIPIPHVLTTKHLVNHLPAILLTAWLLGSCLVATLIASRLLRFHRLLKLAHPPSVAVAAELRRIAELMSIRNTPKLLLLDAPITPMLYCLAQLPILILPDSLFNRLTADQRQTVLAHELAHLMRRDHWVRWIETLATIVFWFHPLLWIARRQLRQSEELCCDAWVIQTLPDARRSYATAIVDTLEHSSTNTPACACGIGRIKNIKRRLHMILSNTQPKAMSRLARFVLVTLLLILPVVPVRAADENSDDKERIAQLEKRVKELESRLAAAEKKVDPRAADPAAATREQIDAQIAKARERMRADRKSHNAEDLEECEQLYQVANRQWRTPQAKESLAKMLEKYSDMNRTGCALVYMGQMSAGDKKVEYLQKSIDKFSDCYYGDGTQVGPWARALLGWHYQENNQPDKAKELFEQIKKDYPDAIEHQGHLLVKVIEANDKTTTQPGK